MKSLLILWILLSLVISYEFIFIRILPCVSCAIISLYLLPTLNNNIYIDSFRVIKYYPAYYTNTGARTLCSYTHSSVALCDPPTSHDPQHSTHATPCHDHMISYIEKNTTHYNIPAGTQQLVKAGHSYTLKLSFQYTVDLCEPVKWNNLITILE